MSGWSEVRLVPSNDARDAGSDQGRGHPEGHEQSGHAGAQLGGVPGRWVGRKLSGVLLVHATEVVRVREQDAHLDDVVKARAGRLQDGLAVRQRLPGLVLDAGARLRTGAHVDPGGT